MLGTECWFPIFMLKFHFPMKSHTLNPQIYSPQICLELIASLLQQRRSHREGSLSASTHCELSLTQDSSGPHRVEDSWDFISKRAAFWSLCVFRDNGLH